MSSHLPFSSGSAYTPDPGEISGSRFGDIHGGFLCGRLHSCDAVFAGVVAPAAGRSSFSAAPTPAAASPPPPSAASGCPQCRQWPQCTHGETGGFDEGLHRARRHVSLGCGAEPWDLGRQAVLRIHRWHALRVLGLTRRSSELTRLTPSGRAQPQTERRPTQTRPASLPLARPPASSPPHLLETKK